MKGDLIEELGPVAERLTVVPNGMPAHRGTRATVRAELGVVDEDVLILAVGARCSRKNHSAIVRALGQVSPEARWHLAIAGRDDDATTDIARAIAETGTASRVHQLGIRHDVGDLLAAADLFCMPSLWEGMPLALIEAMLAGVAPVASRVGGIPEVVEAGVSGLLVDPLNVRELEVALATLIADPSLRRSMANAARERAERVFSSEAMCVAYEAVYMDALQRQSGRVPL
jgi:glycosyltransferase involved in cell wall biosynthesis